MEIIINDEDFPEELLDTVRRFNSSLGSLEDGFKDLLSLNRTEMFQNLDPITRAKIDIVSLYSINSLVWMLLKTLGHNPQTSDVKTELGRVRSAISRCKEIQDREKRGRVDQGAAKRMITSGLWNPGEQKLGSEDVDAETMKEMAKSADPPRKKIRQYDV
ncbi:nuclear nucleic acid-binding protein C1D [Eurytemora carolleeae]|uniref:nuclear nucleic acid-binding protein C1D n=1 Tax=Eurytemora carolleeae TaxID=1294199 RepID=UPI000C75BB05|nr:nuclear nucleic acid-binding protein C1D [Eurytemora carolleeae]|eukprot:XP_023340435.1 nuclear nucleic acid-binding protein C1D-like [Eurytemora affinis]